MMVSFKLWIYIIISTLPVGTRITADEERLIHRCQVYETIMHCTGVVPGDVPDTIRGLEISDVEEDTMSRLGTWNHIESFSIECLGSNNTHNMLPGHVFYEFTNLTYLRISCKNLENISNDAFVGLVNVKVLDLTDCVRLSFGLLSAAVKNKLPSLEELILRRTGLLVTTDHVFDELFQSLRNKPLTHLDLSGTRNGSFDPKVFAKSFPHLRSLNVSEGGFLAIYLAICFYSFSEKLQAIREVDISYPTNTANALEFYISSNSQAQSTPNESVVQNLNLLTIYARGFAPSGVRTRFFGLDEGFRICPQLRILSVNINLPMFCIVKYGYGIPLQRLSMTYNGIEDVDESLTSIATDLRYVDLSHNSLYRMKPGRLENVLKYASKLTEIYASNNLFSSLPYLIFKNTLNLEIIDLSHNSISSIGFKINHLLFLRVLKLDNNKLHTIDAGGRMHLQELIGEICSPDDGNKKVQSCQYIKVDISANPLDCNCENKYVFEWIRDIRAVQYDTLCEIDSKNPSKDRDILSKLELYCWRPVIIATCCGVAGFLIILTTVSVVACIWRKIIQRRKRRIMDLIEKYRVADDAEKFPVFLSYSSVDDQFIHTNVVDKMNTRLQGLLNTDRQCVATGDATFRPGFYIAEEIIKLIELSEVVVLCVSKSFCKSPWCKDEILVSQYQRKPMVLMFLEEVKSSEMPKVLKTFFNKYARSKWVKEGDSVKLIPDWIAVCQSIVDLMRTDAQTTTYL